MKLYEEALKVRLNSHSPYSNFKVGAALLDENGRIHVGTNVENSSYGGTICAEQSAIANMVAAGGKTFKEIVVVTDVKRATPPCGICRQILHEFSSGSSVIHMGNLEGVSKSYPLSELLPEAFDRSYLDKRK